jgi:hypothetical protein
MAPYGHAKVARALVLVGGLVVLIGACANDDPSSSDGTSNEPEASGGARSADETGGEPNANLPQSNTMGGVSSTGGVTTGSNTDSASSNNLGGVTNSLSRGGAASALGGASTGGSATTRATGGTSSGNCSVAYHQGNQTCASSRCHQASCTVATQCQNCLDSGTRGWCPNCQ